MGRGPSITPDQKAHFFSLHAQGWSVPKAAVAAGFSTRTGYGLTGGARNGQEMRDRKLGSKIEGAKPFDQLSPEATEALNDRTGVIWCERYFGYTLNGWQREFWKILEDGWDSIDREFVLLNAPPGGGKSTVMVMFASKLIARDRAVRILFISVAQALASKNSSRLKSALQRVSPQVNKDGSQALASLAVDFGRFKPVQQGIPWTKDEYTVEQMDGTPPEEKEPTVQSYGFDSRFIGNRLDAVFGDDMDTTRGIRNLDVVEVNRDVFDNELEPRLDQGGLFCLTQQRLGAFDFSSHVKSKMVIPDDYDGESELLTPQYSIHTFKAHYEELCRDRETHKRDAKGWPDGCLLDPRNLPWSTVRKAMGNPEVYNVVYQQQDPGESEALVQKIWVDGGRDADGFEFIGCWDRDRDAWQLPQGLKQPLYGVMTVDPSPTKYWSCQSWLLASDAEQRYLLDHHRSRMDAPDFLDWSTHLSDWTGLAEDARKAYLHAGARLTHLIFERNAAQRFVLQYDHFHRWRQKHGIQVIAHDTARNKSDPEFGVQMIGPRYRDGQVRLPGKGQGRIASLRLVDEVTHYPHAPTTDCVMAQWFLEHNAASLTRKLNRSPKKLWRPTWAPKAVAGV